MITEISMQPADVNGAENGASVRVQRLVSTSRPRLLDLFCCGGGAGMGYSQAGFDVVGVDIKPQPRYPFQFVLSDALDYLAKHGEEYDAIHASPPCQKWSTITKCGGNNEHPDLVGPVRELLKEIGKPWVIENVPGAPLRSPLMLCGTMFGLNVIRHRNFETSHLVKPPCECSHTKRVIKHGRRPDRTKHYAAVTGHFSDVAFAQVSMGIDWLGQKELAQAIPPAYTKYIGETLRVAVCANDKLRDPAT